MTELFIGVTSFNSAAFLPHSLGAIRRNTDAKSTRIVVLDNASTDASKNIARSHGAEVLVRQSSQSAALTDLFNASRSTFTLLIHADVILLTPGWLDLCASKMTNDVALVSPEDIGCGPFTRPHGRDMPESSFLFFRTALARRARRWQWRQRFKLQLPYRAFDFSGPHITYNIPGKLAANGLRWKAMAVHTSERTAEPIYTPRFGPKVWYPELAMYRYGLGNFYSLDGTVTHYHNWFERLFEDVPDDSERTLSPESGGLPLAFIKAYTQNFLDDLRAGTVRISDVSRAGAPL